jgi:hypothetical protein
MAANNNEDLAWPLADDALQTEILDLVQQCTRKPSILREQNSDTMPRLTLAFHRCQTTEERSSM